MSDAMVKITLWVETNLVGCRGTAEFVTDKEEWEEMTERQQENYALESLWDSGIIEWGYEVADE